MRPRATLFDRRQLLRGAAAPALSGERIDLSIGHAPLKIGGREAHAIGINGTVPGPLIRLKEGQTVRLAVTNRLADEDTSIHWHGLILPFQMDGVPGARPLRRHARVRALRGRELAAEPGPHCRPRPRRGRGRHPAGARDPDLVLGRAPRARRVQMESSEPDKQARSL